ncbi:MAG: DUF1592 domain-containing protein [Acidobacteria bacterium]|nr:DUF1592 domain-containing protein [Acidobacteriota bacterium]
MGETPSRRAIFDCRPLRDADEQACAIRILTRLATAAYRRPARDRELQTLLDFYAAGREKGSFDEGIQLALERLLVDPNFLFRIERDPSRAAPGTPYDVSDLELASRLSFFLWSSVPDDELLAAAARGQLRNPGMLEQQVRRMLADSRATTLVDGFAGQWLQVRNIRTVYPDPGEFPHFDDNLREALLEETRLFIDSQIREDRGVPELLSADYTFLNERLARHYGVPNVYGSRFRRVPLNGGDRGGLLGHGSILTVTSYPNRTSPVLRGKWILENILGTPRPRRRPRCPRCRSEVRAAGTPPCASGWRRIGTTPPAPRATHPSIHWDSRSRGSTRPGRGARWTRAPSSTLPGRFRAAPRLKGCRDCGRCCWTGASSSCAR